MLRLLIMKKILGILFLSFLISSIIYANENKYKPWLYNNIKISEKCFNHLYPTVSGDWYESYYDHYINKLDKHWGDPKFELFVNTIGNYLAKEIPLGDKYNSSWDEEMSLTRYLNDCNDGDEFKYQVISELPLFFCDNFAPNVEKKCLSIVLIKHYSKNKLKLFSMTVYGLYNINNQLMILPLRNLN